MASGGTGGHIYPALAVATAARDRGFAVTFLGQRGGLEQAAAAEAGLPFVGVAAGKWDRQRPSPMQALAAIGGTAEASRWAARNRPDAVVGFGGFASFPGCFAASLLGLPLFLYEGNAFPGRVVRWFAGRARLVLVTQAPAERYLGRARRIARVGFPVRETRVPRAEARRRLGLPEDAVVTLVMGGSQGSLALNRLLPNVYSDIAAPGRHVVLHSTGSRWLEEVRHRVEGITDYHAVDFVDATVAWSAADLAITRAGFSTLAEAAWHGVPVIAVPLPTSAEDHQRHNAAAVAASGAGYLVDQDDPSGLTAAWHHLLDDGEREPASRAARVRATPGAAATVVDHLESELTSAAGGPDRVPA